MFFFKCKQHLRIESLSSWVISIVKIHSWRAKKLNLFLILFHHRSSNGWYWSYVAGFWCCHVGFPGYVAFCSTVALVCNRLASLFQRRPPICEELWAERFLVQGIHKTSPLLHRHFGYLQVSFKNLGRVCGFSIRVILWKLFRSFGSQQEKFRMWCCESFLQVVHAPGWICQIRVLLL